MWYHTSKLSFSLGISRVFSLVEAAVVMTKAELFTKKKVAKTTTTCKLVTCVNDICSFYAVKGSCKHVNLKEIDMNVLLLPRVAKYIQK